MQTFPVPPDDCLILKTFHESKSLREAAAKLGADPAGLTRKAQQISKHYGYLQKVNNRWIVTARGLDLVAWVESCIQSQKKILQFKSGIRLASTMWLSEELLVPHLPQLKSVVGADLNISMTVPNKGFELSLIDGSVDFAIVCHPPENPEIEHRALAMEEWALIAPSDWKTSFKNYRGEILGFLKKRPFIRHSEMNLDLFMPEIGAVKESDLQIDNLISIRSAVSEGFGWSLVPRLLIRRHLKNHLVMEIPYDLSIRDRKVCLWWLRNRSESKRLSGKMTFWLKAALESRS